jgi:hypothetical protein
LRVRISPSVLTFEEPWSNGSLPLFHSGGAGSIPAGSTSYNSSIVERLYMLRRIAVGFAMIALSTLAIASPAFANGANFHSTSSSVADNGSLVVSFDERGLGNDNIDYVLTADATAEYACINGGENHPQAANKETVNAEVSASGSFEPKNGRVVASLSAGPPSAGLFSCPSGQHLVLASVSYTNVVLTDVSNGVVANVSDVSRTFFNV